MKKAKEIKGIVFNVQRYTVHDGPGTRTELFLKGCPLRCLWCANPEGFHRYVEIGLYVDRCIGVDKCGYCLDLCPDGNSRGILTIENNVITSIDRELCSNCLKCAQACPGNALVVWGETMTVSEAVREVLKDREFYGSKGGVTISGGEPLAQWEFTLEVMKACKKAGIHTCIESTFYGPWNVIEQILEYADYIYTDIKHMDSDKHKEYIGAGNELILENLTRISKMGIPYVIRMPVIPYHNDSPENARATAAFIVDAMGNTVRQVQLLAFHEYGRVKYDTLGLKYPLEGRKWPDRVEQKARITEILDIMKSYGVPAVIGSNESVD
ncbi:MAG: glycyl-radical enzyme activating protein [Firmicutes bacterium]|nr:glycyl-radical enzyme activating protein [Bacillota bacterium]